MIKQFDFTAPEFINGRWVKTRRTGTGRVIAQGFQMQIGTEGFVLSVIDGNHYTAGEIITLTRDSVK